MYCVSFSKITSLCFWKPQAGGTFISSCSLNRVEYARPCSLLFALFAGIFWGWYANEVNRTKLSPECLGQLNRDWSHYCRSLGCISTFSVSNFLDARCWKDSITFPSWSGPDNLSSHFLKLTLNSNRLHQQVHSWILNSGQRYFKVTTTKKGTACINALVHYRALIFLRGHVFVCVYVHEPFKWLSV